MSRATRPRALLLLIGAFVVVAGLISGGGHRSRVEARMPAPALVTVAAPAHAAPSPVRGAAVQPSTVAGAQGMRIFKDPNSDMPGPPTQENSALEMEGNSEDMTGLKEEVLPDGSVMIDLQGRFQESMVMQITPDGKRVVTCTRDVKQTLSHPPVSPAQREER